MNWWRGSKRPEEQSPVRKPYWKRESESVPLPMRDYPLTMRRSMENQGDRPPKPRVNTGEPIPEPDRKELENAFRSDLAEVRVHRDQESAELAIDAGADAFTTGRDIYFAPGAYGPATLAHEVSHVIQQGQANSYMQREDAALEHEAEKASLAAKSGRFFEISRSDTVPIVQRQPTPGITPSSQRQLPTQSVILDEFDIDNFALTSTHQAQLTKLAERLQDILASAPDTFVNIVGFADAPGTESHNRTLGQQRADVVRDYLIACGVPAGVLYAASLGEALPRIETKKYEAKNRRVAIDIFQRNFFQPSLKLLPPAPIKTPPVVSPKSIDLTYKPEIHIPTPKEELEENVRRNEEIWKQAQEILKREKARPGTSVADLFGRAAREITKKLGLPKWVQDRAEALAQDLPSKGAQAIFDQIAAERSFDQGTKDAIKAVLNALMKSKIK